MRKELLEINENTDQKYEKASFVIPAFDLFGFDNKVLVHVLKNVAKKNVILLTNDEKINRLQTVPAREIKVPVFDGDYLNKYTQYLVGAEKIQGIIVFLLPFFPFRRKTHLDEALNIFKRMKPSFLITMSTSGDDAEAIYITTSSNFVKSNNFFTDPCNAFVYMADNVLGAKAMEPEKCAEILKTGIQRVEYLTVKQKELASKYRDNLKDYDSEFSGNRKITDPVILRSAKDAPQRISKLAKLKKGDRILDVGCSSGNVTIRYARNTGSDGYVVGIDIDKELIETARQFLKKEPWKTRKKVRFILTSVEDFRDRPESFDTITATEFFEHVLHVQHDTMMRHCLKFLKPNGNFIVSVPNRFVKDTYALQRRYRWDWHNHYTHFTKKSLEYFLSRYFKKVKFHSVYDEKPEEGIFLIAEGMAKK